jgi:hypothetical protein
LCRQYLLIQPRRTCTRKGESARRGPLERLCYAVAGRLLTKDEQYWEVAESKDEPIQQETYGRRSILWTQGSSFWKFRQGYTKWFTRRRNYHINVPSVAASYTTTRAKDCSDLVYNALLEDVELGRISPLRRSYADKGGEMVEYTAAFDARVNTVISTLAFHDNKHYSKQIRSYFLRNKELFVHTLGSYISDRVVRTYEALSYLPLVKNIRPSNGRPGRAEEVPSTGRCTVLRPSPVR